MKKRILFMLLGLLVGSSSFAKGEDTPRKTLNINREWKYCQGDYKGAETVSFNDSEWQMIGLPHSFSIPYFMSKDFYVGYGWYRKTLKLNKEDIRNCQFLEFDGVFQEAEIFVNGRKMGAHKGGYTGFSIDITSAIAEGDNLIAVRVNDLWQPDLAPRGGEHVFSGGIYRNVRLVMKSPAHIDWCGTFVTTPDLAAHNGESSSVNIRTDLCNQSSKNGKFKLLTQIIDNKGNEVAFVENSLQLKVGESLTVEQKTKAVNNPVLWHPSHPVCYKVISKLYEGNRLIDSEETEFGFRWFEWTADKGFFLNGEHFFFHGANVHQDQAGWGDAVTEAAARRDVRMIKEAGFEMIRGSHYPHSPAFAQACDNEGLLFWSEAPFWATAGEKVDGYWTASGYPVKKEDIEGFEASALRQLEEMIRINRNHPSIFVWSMCNEPFFSSREAMDGMKGLLRKMVDRAHQLDPTRLAAIGGAQRPLGDERIDRIGDVAGYNGDGSTIIDFQNPGIPSVVSEYGSTTTDRPGEYAPGWGDLEKNDAWKGVEWRSGQAIWCGFDHGTIFPPMGKMGLVDYYRLPKRSWYWYRNEYAHIAPPQWPSEGIPATLKLEATKYNGVLADGTDDVQLIVTVLDAEGNHISNTPDVTLRLISGPGEFPTGTSITFKKEGDIQIFDGQAAIAFRSYYAGNAVIEASSYGLTPARITVEFEGAPAYIQGETPIVRERPYTRYVRGEQGELKSFGCNNPTFASSSAQGFSAGYAADGNNQTYWQPESNDQQICWTLDMERWPIVKQINFEFEESKAYQYFVEVSADQKDWIMVTDNSQNQTGDKRQSLDVNVEKGVRYVRFRFPKGELFVAPKLSEVEVKGLL